MLDFQQHPGLYFVAATFAPLASFVLILLAKYAWGAVRPYRDTALGEKLYNLLGGDVGGRGASYIALGAIALSCLLSIIGFIKFSSDQGENLEDRLLPRETRVADLRAQLKQVSAEDQEIVENKVERLEGEIEKYEHDIHRIEAEWQAKRAATWSGHVDWIKLRPVGLSDADRGTTLRLGYAIDSLSGLMFVMVTFIATLIHLFSMAYMKDELEPVVEDHQVHTAEGHLHRRGRFGRFFMFLSLFCFSMLNLVLADNLLQVFISWELVGVCSYLLIGFYYERQSASNAANKAFITNRIGDAGFLIGLMILWNYVGTFNFEEIFSQVRGPLRDGGKSLPVAGQMVRVAPVPGPQAAGEQRLHRDPNGPDLLLFPRMRPETGADLSAETVFVAHTTPKPDQRGVMPYWLMVVAGLGIFLGCVGKSAQVPLQVWLPDAMEGPTPVSALIHAATMVAAGVYLVGRCYPIFAPEALLVIAYVGGITLFVAATIAVVMTDIKKVLAYSTVSQLGYMMLALGVGGWVAGLFHLMTHAFFKALLFLCSGAVIYNCHHEQDMLRMGGLYPKMKVTALCMLFGVLAIAGIPLFTGWYSKDAILAQAFGFAAVHRQHWLLFLLPLVTAGITAFYMSRMWLMTFTGTPRDEHVYEHAHESPWQMTVPLIILAGCSFFVAWGWPIWDAKASALEHNIHHAQPSAVLADFGHVLDERENWPEDLAKVHGQNVRQAAYEYHELAGGLALGLVALGALFAGLLYYYRVLDPEEAKEQAPRLHAFLTDKWGFDRLYGALLVQPALVVAHAFKAFDLMVIDGIIHATARGTVQLSRWDGRFDQGIIDGLVNLIADVTYGVGAWLRNVQTGYLRSYVLYLVLAAIGIFVVLSYFVSLAA